MHGKKQKVQFGASSRYSGTTYGLDGASDAWGGTRRTIANFLDIGGRDEVHAKVVRFLYVCGVPFNVLCSPYWHDMVVAIKARKAYKSLGHEKVRIVLLDRERAKIQRDFVWFTDEWAESGVSIVFEF
jgi:hypothetical protein